LKWIKSKRNVKMVISYNPIKAMGGGLAVIIQEKELPLDGRPNERPSVMDNPKLAIVPSREASLRAGLTSSLPLALTHQQRSDWL
jgi:hypothetical protein